MPNITPMLWFDGNAEEAARFYTSTFPNSHIDKVVKAAADTPSNKKGRGHHRRVHARRHDVRRPQRWA